MKTRFLPFILLIVLACSSLAGQNLLVNSDFEKSMPNGTFPSSGWQPSWYPTTAGSVTTSTAAKEGRSGLWMYTSDGPDSNSKPYQEVNCTPLASYKAEAYLRSPEGQSWTAGTVAYISIAFNNQNGVTLASANSGNLTTGNIDWKLLTVSLTAPKGSAKVRFTVNLISQKGQSICNVDNCSLVKQ